MSTGFINASKLSVKPKGQDEYKPLHIVRGADLYFPDEATSDWNDEALDTTFSCRVKLSKEDRKKLRKLMYHRIPRKKKKRVKKRLANNLGLTPHNIRITGVLNANHFINKNHLP